ncbi:GDP-mannose 4,6-dehydratase [bacterium]|nr:GDP-mannose 4,6-dehydratase [bacterium]
MKILVTGGAGFIGSHLTEYLLKEGHFVVCIDNFNNYYDPLIKRHNIKNAMGSGNYLLEEGDICDVSFIEDIFNKHKFDSVIHLAARAGVRPSIENPKLYQKVNIEGTVTLLDASVRYNVNKFVLASSSSVYGNNKKHPFSESDNVDFPISPYAATKKACELLAYTYHSIYSISVSCLRFFTVYGPRQRPDMAIHKFTRLISEGKRIPIYGDGTTKRDYTFISDIVDGIVRSLDKCKGYNIYNLGESRTVELGYLISLIENAVGKKANIEYLPMQPGDVDLTYADVSKAKKELGYNPSVPIEEGIVRFAEWFKKTLTGK